jgi:DNA-binding MarR family transcriptional regulator
MISEPPRTQGQLPTPIEPCAPPNAGEVAPVGVLLAEVNALAIRLKQRGRAIPDGPGEFFGAEHAVLDIIARVGNLTVPQIARERSTSRQNIQILVDRLAAQGRIELVTNPAHKRSGLVRLTEKGKRWLSAGEQGQKQTLSDIGSQLSEIEINATASVLRKIHSLLSGAQQKDQTRDHARLKRVVGGVNPASPSGWTEAESVGEDFPLNLL